MNKIEKLRAEREATLSEVQDIREQINEVRRRIERYAQIRRDLISDEMVKKGIGICSGCDLIIAIKDLKVLTCNIGGTKKRGNYCEKCYSAVIQELEGYYPVVVKEKPIFDPRNFPDKIVDFVGKYFPEDIEYPEFK